MSEVPEITEGGVIENVAVADLTPMTSPDELRRVRLIRNTAVVLIGKSAAAAIPDIRMENVASVVTVPDGGHVRVHTGSLTVDGRALAEPGGDNEIMVVTGTLIVTTPVERVGYHDLIVTGVVLAPEGSEAALGSGITRLTGAVTYFPYAEGQQVRVHSGQVRFGARAMANAGGNPGDVLVVGGQLVVTEPLTTLGYARIVVSGQLMAPRQSEDLIGPASLIQGQVVWYAGDPRFFTGEDSFSAEFFRLQEKPITLALIGDFEFEADVTSELLREKVSSIALIGEVRAPKALIPALQMLATERIGDIRVAVEAQAG
ncbi:MAG TPA: hypothetical protein VIA06_13525 [Candidatus Dormibacteraeota bacterium]|jgi:hypothetical protein|nr:hypothetical protein [Candidatus Dormibacteraeota bacterium]